MTDNELIQVKQLPIIVERLRDMKEHVEQITSEALSLACTPDTYTSVKEKRAELNKLFSELETRRKLVKSEILAPYQEFESVYKECVSDIFSAADTALASKIRAVEDGIKGQCETRLRAFYDELCEVNGIDFIPFEKTGVKIDMTSAKQKEPRKLMDALAQVVCSAACDLDAIRKMDNAEEIIVEYKKTLNATAAISAVQERHRAIEEAKKSEEQKKVQEAEKSPPAPQEGHIQAPRRVEAAAVEELTVTFSVTGTRERLKLLKNWLIANHYDFT